MIYIAKNVCWNLESPGIPLPEFCKFCIMITNIQSLICEINPRGKLTTNVLFYEKKYNLDWCSNAISPTDLVYFLCFSSSSYFYLFCCPNVPAPIKFYI